jgi:hypothetical protein
MTNISAFDALGDPTRRMLFERLRQGSCSVTELLSVVPISQPAVSQHLKVLRARLVRVGAASGGSSSQCGWQNCDSMLVYGMTCYTFGEEAERLAGQEKAARVYAEP